MKLKNKKTGQIGNFILNKDYFKCVDLEYVPKYRNLSELVEVWEDYEGQKKYWYILDNGDFDYDKEIDSIFNERCKEIGNYFETKEEAEQAVEKLKAWKRLKDNGIKIKGWKFTPDMHHIKGNFVKVDFEIPYIIENEQDLDLLFGGQ